MEVGGAPLRIISWRMGSSSSSCHRDGLEALAAQETGHCCGVSWQRRLCCC